MAKAGGNKSDSEGPETLPKTKHSQVAFELQFFGEILRANPGYVEVLRAQAHNLSVRGRHAEGLEVDKRLVTLRPQDPFVHYNLACSYSLLNMNAAALGSLEAALRLGYCDFEHLLSDADLENVRVDPRFMRMIRIYWNR